MSPLIRELAGSSAQFALPVKLSAAARRDVLLRSGQRPEIDQVFAIPSLMYLEPEERGRLVNIVERVNIAYETDDPYEVRGPWSESVVTANVDGYGALQRADSGRWIRSRDDGVDLLIDEVFYATPERTINAKERFERTLDKDDVDAFRSMLVGAPLVLQIGDSSGLELEHVLGAYERASMLAGQFIALVDAGVGVDDNVFRVVCDVTDDGVFFLPDVEHGASNSAAAILRESSPKAYSEARQLCEHLRATSDKDLSQIIDALCGTWWGAHYAKLDDATKLGALTYELKRAALQGEAAKVYEMERASWIGSFGSERLRRAAARGYRHDRIYLEERLDQELSGFVSTLGRKPETRELINPSEQALEVEDEVLSRARQLRIGDDQVRLIWAQPDSELSAGEYVQIRSYLGRHKVWRPVWPEEMGLDADAPF